ncbi:type II toxin-antitoxin system PemK/MazF family toxin [Candidatus Micrarchaeota archaeon]|nr:type II toxin-antitoxin system PemK/MazF family toxin [Candidatus Micrarchaeota archaeon]
MKKGEIWLTDLPEGKGHEQRGIRPSLVLGTSNNMAIILPMTKNTSCLKFEHTLLMGPTKENGLTEQSVVLAFHIDLCVA